MADALGNHQTTNLRLPYFSERKFIHNKDPQALTGDANASSTKTPNRKDFVQDVYMDLENYILIKADLRTQKEQPSQ